MLPDSALPDVMRAAVYLETGRLEVQERPLPELGPRAAEVTSRRAGTVTLRRSRTALYMSASDVRAKNKPTEWPAT